MNNALGNRIRKRRLELNLTQEELAKRVGYTSRSSINKIEIGKNFLTQPKIITFAEALNTTPSYLMGWDDPSNITPVDSVLTFPIIGSVRAGYDGAAIEESLGEDIVVPSNLIKHRRKEDFFVLQVKGDSMYPKFLDGDRVLVERTSSVDSGAIAVILYNQTEATLKKVEYVYGEEWLNLIPLNTNYPPLRIEGADLANCKVLGKVVYLFRSI